MQYPRYVIYPDATLLQQYQKMVDEVGRLLGQPLVPERRHHDLDSLLTHLLGQPLRALLDEPGRIRPLRHLPVTLGYGSSESLDHRPEKDVVVGGRNSVPGQSSEEAALLAGVAGRSVRLDPVEERVPVA